MNHQTQSKQITLTKQTSKANKTNIANKYKEQHVSCL